MKQAIIVASALLLTGCATGEPHWRTLPDPELWDYYHAPKPICLTSAELERQMAAICPRPGLDVCREAIHCDLSIDQWMYLRHKAAQELDRREAQQP
jgi:hypothetical protein